MARRTLSAWERLPAIVKLMVGTFITTAVGVAVTAIVGWAAWQRTIEPRFTAIETALEDKTEKADLAPLEASVRELAATQRIIQANQNLLLQYVMRGERPQQSTYTAERP